jgi:integrase
MSKLYKRKGIWYADLRALGGGQRSTGCTDLGAARARLRQLERAAVAGQGEVQARPRHSVAEAVQHLLDTTQSRSNHYELRAAHLMRLMGAVDVGDLDLEKVTRYIKARLAEHGAPIPPPPDKPWWKPRTQRVSKHTVHKELAALGRALRLARRRRWPDGTPYFTGHAEDLLPDDFSAEYRPRERWLTPREFEALLKVLPAHRQLWLALAAYLGARASEVAGLRWEHIHWDAAQVELWGTKTEGSARVVPLPKPLAQVLAPLRREPGGAERTGPVVGPWPNDCRDITAACKRAGITRCTPNDLRRTYASWLAQGGQSALTIARLLGHTTSHMAERVYARLSRDSLAQAVKVLPKRPRRRKA